jgi:bifunctional non-homologous end joining protein LigD
MSLHPPGFIEPCLPTGSPTAPTGPQWAYEIKHDGFRFICHRDGERVRVFSRTGHEWGAQLPAIAAALRALPVRSVILDGEGVICGPDGVSDFDRMRAVFSRKGSPDVFLYAFDVLELDGRDLRAQSWDARRALLTQLLDRCQDGLRLSEHIADTDARLWCPALRVASPSIRCSGRRGLLGGQLGVATLRAWSYGTHVREPSARRFQSAAQ